MSTLPGPRFIPYGGDEMRQIAAAAVHRHTSDGGVTVCFGDGYRVLHVRHRSNRNPVPAACVYEPGGLNLFGNRFVYTDYFLPSDLAKAPVPPASQTRTVTIPAREEHDGFDALTLRLPWVCLHCGGPRGEPFDTKSYDGSRQLACHGWFNPCGHVEKYSEVRASITTENHA